MYRDNVPCACVDLSLRETKPGQVFRSCGKILLRKRYWFPDFEHKALTASRTYSKTSLRSRFHFQILPLSPFPSLIPPSSIHLSQLESLFGIAAWQCKSIMKLHSPCSCFYFRSVTARRLFLGLSMHVSERNFRKEISYAFLWKRSKLDGKAFSNSLVIINLQRNHL